MLLFVTSARRVDAELSRPLSLGGSRYVRSDACVQCHPGKHESWRRTFHRTMTQDASDAAVLGHFDGRSLSYGGFTARMERDRAGAFQMRFERADGRERWTAQVARTVGSRRYQQYLTRQGDTWLRLPVAWSVEEQRFMHMNGAFLTPDPERAPGQAAIARTDYDRHVTRWNDNCVYCHNVAPSPGLDPRDGSFDTHVAELGIACEACHGPASEHVAVNKNPLRRYALHLRPRSDPTIANPRRLPAERSAQVCGRCHGQRLSPDIEQVHRFGDRFTPGEDLGSFSKPLFRDTTLSGEPGVFEPRFWPDGTPRLTAYEYQGLLLSKCGAEGNFSCESCHAMHEGDRRGQLRPDRLGDAACTSCHAALREPEALRAHSHHAPEGAGARCLDCHMPRVVYGLVSAHRSHRIDSPAPTPLGTVGRPDACTLCHVERSVRWAQDALETWRTASTVGAAGEAGEAATTPEVSRLLLAGDPIERAVAAAALGRADVEESASAAPEARAAQRVAARLQARLPRLLDAMQHDRYPAIRAIAFRSLRGLLLAYDPRRAPARDAFTATDEVAARERAIAALCSRLPPELTLALPAELSALRAQANDVAIFIGE